MTLYLPATVRKLEEAISKIAPIAVPPKRQNLSEWADNNRILSPEDSAEPGRWNSERFRLQIDIMNEMSEVEVEIEASTEEVPVEVPVEEVRPVSIEEVQSMIVDQMNPIYTAIEELAKELVMIKEGMVSLQEKYSKFSKEPAGQPVPRIESVIKNEIDPLESRIEKLKSLKGEIIKNNKK